MSEQHCHTGSCTYCAGDGAVTMSDGSKRTCELCNGSGKHPPDDRVQPVTVHAERWIRVSERLPTYSDVPQEPPARDAVMCWFPKPVAYINSIIGPGWAMVSWYNVEGWGNAISHWRRLPDGPLSDEPQLTSESK